MALGSLWCSALAAHALTQLQTAITTASLPPAHLGVALHLTAHPSCSPHSWPRRHQVERVQCQLLPWFSAGDVSVSPLSLMWANTDPKATAHKPSPSHSRQAGKWDEPAEDGDSQQEGGNGAEQEKRWLKTPQCNFHSMNVTPCVAAQESGITEAELSCKLIYWVGNRLVNEIICQICWSLNTHTSTHSYYTLI